MSSKQIAVRLAEQLNAEAEKRAASAGVSVGVWLRMLAERETGIVVPMREGFQGMDPATAQKIRDAGVKARQARKDTQTDPI